MIELDKITVKQLFELPDEQFVEYQRILSNLKPKPNFGYFKGVDFIELPFGKVSEIIENITTLEGIKEAFCIVFSMKECNFFNGDVTDFFYAFNWIKTQIIHIQAREEKAFSQDEFSESAEKWKEASKGRLDKFGILNVTMSLGKQFGKLPSEIQDLPYHEVFGMLLQTKEFNQVEADYHNLIMKQNDIQHGKGV